MKKFIAHSEELLDVFRHLSSNYICVNSYMFRKYVVLILLIVLIAIPSGRAV